MDYGELHKRTVDNLVESVYHQCLINNAERGAYVEHIIILALLTQLTVGSVSLMMSSAVRRYKRFDGSPARPSNCL